MSHTQKECKEGSRSQDESKMPQLFFFFFGFTIEKKELQPPKYIVNNILRDKSARELERCKELLPNKMGLNYTLDTEGGCEKLLKNGDGTTV